MTTPTKATPREPASGRPLDLGEHWRAVAARCTQPTLLTLWSRATLRADQAPRDGKEKPRG